MAPVTSGGTGRFVQIESNVRAYDWQALIACCDFIVAVFMRDAPFSLRT